MGMFKASNCDCQPDRKVTIYEKIYTWVSGKDSNVVNAEASNPDPKNFHIKMTHQAGAFIAAIIVYPDCKNYEGEKIMVLRSNREKLGKLDFLDPHFCEGEHTSPIARFEPTLVGWRYAIEFAESLNREDKWR